MFNAATSCKALASSALRARTLGSFMALALAGGSAVHFGSPAEASPGERREDEDAVAATLDVLVQRDDDDFSRARPRARPVDQRRVRRELDDRRVLGGLPHPELHAPA